MVKKFSTLLGLALIITSGYSQIQKGKASFYADKFEGRPTASGEKYKHNKLTAAHKMLPFGTKVKVTNPKNGKSVVVLINDRGPYVEGRVIDLSKSAAEKIDIIHQGVAEVTVEVIDHGDGKGGGLVHPSHHAHVEEREFYTMKIDRLTPNGFGIQIGSFREMANLLRLTHNLKASYKKQVIVQVKVVKSTKMYTVIVGDFASIDKAIHFKEKLKKRYPDAFVVEYKKL